MSKMVVLDAGHGGKDPGAIGLCGTKEKDVAMQVTSKIGEVLVRHGVKVVYTRAQDINTSQKLELATRTSIANNAKADLFVSIHANSAANNAAHGQETYAYQTGDTGYKLAQAIQKEMVGASGLKDRGVKTADYYVIKYTTMPAALVELAFISNIEEEKLLKDANWQEKMAVAIAKGILTTLNIKYTEPTAPTDAEESYFKESWAWAKELGITDGSNPKGAAKREHVIEFLYRFYKKVK